ncbi:MAG: hypothetical protein CM1200mP2_09350 [Planctomycetaceae bacterium]|nr:MAG: hypothetical protein CM1200mP2_09350 [Planctomycetaceae bacterium]
MFRLICHSKPTSASQARTNKLFVGVRVEFDNYRLVLENDNNTPKAWFEQQAEDGQSVRRRAIDPKLLLRNSKEGGLEWPTRLLKLPLYGRHRISQRVGQDIWCRRRYGGVVRTDSDARGRSDEDLGSRH